MTNYSFPNKLNPDLWNPSGELKDDVKEKLLEIGLRFYKYLKIEAVLLDILFTGSLANYNWTQYSDIDLHIIIDFDKVNIGSADITRDFFLAKKNVWNDKRNIFIKGIPVELYAQHVHEPHAATGQYSLYNGWLVHPTPIEQIVDNRKLSQITSLLELLIEKVACIKNADLQFSEAVELKDQIIQLRRRSIDSSGELGLGNLAFKQLRNSGSLDKLFGFISSSMDKKLSLEQQEKHYNKLVTEALMRQQKKMHVR